MRAVLGILIGLLVSGCGEPLSGWAWEVTLTGATDTCNDPTVPYQETLEYVLDFEGSFVELRIGEEVFANGTVAGCDILYESVVWDEDRDGNLLRWKIEGEAIYRQVDGGCNLPIGVDWLGTEKFIIVSSAVPEVPAGCFYEMDVEGTYLGEL